MRKFWISENRPLYHIGVLQTPTMTSIWKQHHFGIHFCWVGRKVKTMVFFSSVLIYHNLSLRGNEAHHTVNYKYNQPNVKLTNEQIKSKYLKYTIKYINNKWYTCTKHHAKMCTLLNQIYLSQLFKKKNCDDSITILWSHCFGIKLTPPMDFKGRVDPSSPALYGTFT